MKHNKRTKGKVGDETKRNKSTDNNQTKRVGGEGGGAMVVTITWKKGVHGIGVILGYKRSY